jgi:acetyltransferase-like isoleucine patch superfamily enzyme
VAVDTADAGPGHVTAGQAIGPEYVEVEYAQFRGGALGRARRLAGALTWPLAWPLARLCRRSDVLFRTVSELLSLVPYVFGVVLRGEFYRFALRRCGRNVIVEFGSVFIYPDVSLGENVLIGRYNTVHHCDFGSYVLTAEHCSFLSGSQYHRHERTDIPMALQGGRKKRIRIGDDCWIGAHAVVMESVGSGAIVGAGAVVTRAVEPLTIVAGNPARPLRRRGERGVE